MSNPASLEASPGFFEQLAEKAESHGAGGQNDVNLENSGASVVVEDIHEWPKVNPQHVYNQIRAVTDADKGSNKNVFYTSYGKDWTKLTTQQKDKARSFFLKLPQAKQTQILMNAADLTRTDADKGMAVVTSEGQTKAPPTTKHEVARLMHLMVDPAAMAHWGIIKNPMDRGGLDSRKSDAPGHGGKSMAEESSGWLGMLELFNDVHHFYENCGVEYRAVADGNPVKIDPSIHSTTFCSFAFCSSAVSPRRGPSGANLIL